ncbi:MAG TPA: hypothetical protein VFE17_06325 [Candidatus Baltobacteraceae bacterium]|nr:hypothetical protein [Candidatus Baltobacteraceae bacterium]
MIKSEEIPGRFKEALPAFTLQIDKVIEEFGSSTPYNLVDVLFAMIVQGLRTFPDTAYLAQAFFDTCELMIWQGDEHVFTIVATQAIHPVALETVHDVKLERFLGPRSKNELRMHMEGMDRDAGFDREGSPSR